MMPLDISVIIPAYCAERWIARSLGSVLKQQNNVDLEVIVVDDASKDNTATIVKEFHNVKYYRLPHNSGAPVARNYGLSLASGRYVLFLDADDFIKGPLLSGLVSVLDDSMAHIAFGPMRFDGDINGPSDILFAQMCNPLEWVAARLLGSRWTSPWPGRVAWRTETLRKDGGWKEGLPGGQDEELVLRCLLRGRSLTVSYDGCGVYWQHSSPTRISNSRDDDASALMALHMIKSWIEQNPNEGGVLTMPLASYCYRFARRAYSFKDEDRGRWWLDQARSLGLSGHPGSRGHSFLAGLVGLRLKEIISRIFKI